VAWRLYWCCGRLVRSGGRCFSATRHTTAVITYLLHASNKQIAQGSLRQCAAAYCYNSSTAARAHLVWSAKARAFSGGVSLLLVISGTGAALDGTATGEAASTGPWASGAIFYLPACSSAQAKPNPTVKKGSVMNHTGTSKETTVVTVLFQVGLSLDGLNAGLHVLPKRTSPSHFRNKGCVALRSCRRCTDSQSNRQTYMQEQKALLHASSTLPAFRFEAGHV
jgi:hypothetical protein